MLAKFFKKTTAAAFGTMLALQAASVLAATPPIPETALTRSDVERIVHEYIMAHPDDILAAVQSFQDKMARNQQQDAVKRNRDDLYATGASPEIGNPKGDVTVVEFFDYNCGYCKKVTPQLVQLVEDDKNVRVVLKDLPILGPSSETASKWALAAHKQGKYFTFHQALMKNRAPITDTLLEQTAQLVGVNVNQARTDMGGTEFLLQIERNRALATKMDVHGTPAFAIGDELAPGAISLDEMKSMIAKARAAKKSKPEDSKKKD